MGGHTTLGFISPQNWSARLRRGLRKKVTGPEWLNDVHLDIVGKAAGPANETQLFSMLRPLLAERLGVMTHIERKEAQVYVLTLAKGEPKFSESTTEGPPSGRGIAGHIIYERFAMSELSLAAFTAAWAPRCRCDWVEGHVMTSTWT